MTYAAVTKSNCLFQPRENIKTLIENNLTDKTIQIYSYFPNQKAANFKGYPFVVIPDFSDEVNEEFPGTDVREYLNEVEGSLIHEVKSLGDNKLRVLKQDIFQAINKKANERILNGYGMNNVTIEMKSSSPEPISVDQNELIEIPFDILFDIEVNFV